MRTVQRNKRNVWYALYLGENEEQSADENYTGEMNIYYSEPVRIRANVSPATGQNDLEPFGDIADYDKIVVTDEVDIPIDENSILWIDTAPVVGHGIDGYNYTVNRVARSFNSVSIAVRKVDVHVPFTPHPPSA